MQNDIGAFDTQIIITIQLNNMQTDKNFKQAYK